MFQEQGDSANCMKYKLVVCHKLHCPKPNVCDGYDMAIYNSLL